MTIQDLLRHTAGLAYDTTSHADVRAAYPKEGVTWKDLTPSEQIERLARVPVAHQPGQRRAEDRDLLRQLVQAALVD